jgi:hypothetical protein
MKEFVFKLPDLSEGTVEVPAPVSDRVLLTKIRERFDDGVFVVGHALG